MRRKLTAAALRIYVEEGLEAVSFRRLAEVTGVSHTLPYRYFDNKEALLAHMRVDALGGFERYVRENGARARTPQAQIVAVAEAYIMFARDQPAEYLLIFSTHQPAAELYPELLQARRSLFDHAVGVLERAIEAGLLNGDAREIAHEIWVGLHGLMTLHAAGQLVHGMGFDELVEPLMTRLLGVPISLTRRTRTRGRRSSKATIRDVSDPGQG